MKPLYKRYENEEPAGVYSMGYCGYLFFEPIGDDREHVTRWGNCDFVVCYEYPNSQDAKGYTRKDYRRHTVRYAKSGRPYISRDGAKIYLDDVMRTDY